MSHHNERMVESWEVAHPMTTAFWNAATLGIWPGRRFGMSGACTFGDYGVGFPIAAWSALRHTAYGTFHFMRAVFAGFFGVLYGWIAWPFVVRWSGELRRVSRLAWRRVRVSRWQQRRRRQTQCRRSGVPDPS
jgi:hypothetical protein